MSVTVDGIEDADFEAAVAEVLWLPVDSPERGRRAAALIEVLLRLASRAGTGDPEE